MITEIKGGTPELVAALKARLEQILAPVYLPNPAGDAVPFKVYVGEPPDPANDDDTDPELQAVPYALIRISEGSYADWRYTRHVSLMVVLCIFDQDNESTGTERMAGLLDMIFLDFAREPNLADFHLTLPLEWTVETELETRPYYFGAMRFDFEGGGADILQDADLT